MPLLLDHIFIITAPGAAVAEHLIEFGLNEGTTNTHPGQGTSNRRFFLNDFTLELVYVSDANEAASGAGKGLGILPRSDDTKASPFGIVVRVADKHEKPDFPSWQYFPDYFDGKMCFHVGENSDLSMEPLCICMPPALPKRKRSSIPVEYRNPDWHLLAAQIDVPIATPSRVLKQFGNMEEVTIRADRPHKLTLSFNHSRNSNTVDFSPQLPLSIEY